MNPEEVNPSRISFATRVLEVVLPVRKVLKLTMGILKPVSWVSATVARLRQERLMGVNEQDGRRRGVHVRRGIIDRMFGGRIVELSDRG